MVIQSIMDIFFLDKYFNYTIIIIINFDFIAPYIDFKVFNFKTFQMINFLKSILFLVYFIKIIICWLNFNTIIINKMFIANFLTTLFMYFIYFVKIIINH